MRGWLVNICSVCMGRGCLCNETVSGYSRRKLWSVFLHILSTSIGLAITVGADSLGPLMWECLCQQDTFWTSSSPHTSPLERIISKTHPLVPPRDMIPIWTEHSRSIDIKCSCQKHFEHPHDITRAKPHPWPHRKAVSWNIGMLKIVYKTNFKIHI